MEFYKNNKCRYIIHISVIIGIIALIMLMFTPIIKGFFEYDDFILLQQAKLQWSITRPYTFLIFSQNGLFTPFNNFLFWTEFQIFGLNQIGYRFVSISLHIINSLLVTKLCFLLTNNRQISITSGVLFATGFAHHEAVSWIAAYVHLVTTFFYLCTVIYFISWLHTPYLRYYITAIVCFIIGLLSKESIVTLPIILAISFLLPEVFISSKRFILSILPFFILAGIYIPGMYVWQKIGPSAVFLKNGTYNLDLQHLLNFQYLASLIIPFPSAPITNFVSRSFILNIIGLYNIFFVVIAVLFLIFITYLILNYPGIIRYSSLWIIITFLPFIFVYGGSSRYLYIPSVCFSILLSVILNILIKKCSFNVILVKAIYMFTSIYIISNISLFYIWQEQMNNNGQIRQSLIDQIVSLNSVWKKTDIICVDQLNSKFWDIDMALPLWIQNAPDFKISSLDSECSSEDKNISYYNYYKDRLIQKK